MPSTILIVSMVLVQVWFYFGNKKRAVKVQLILVLLLLAASNQWFIYQAIKPLEHAYLPDLQQEYKRLQDVQKAGASNKADQLKARAVVVLGSAYIEANDLPEGAKIFLHGQGRLFAGLSLYQLLGLGSETKAHFIVSGYAGSNVVSYAEVAARQVQSIGVVQAEHLRVLNEPKTTAEEAQAIAEVLGDQPFYLVTSAFHMPRAMALMQAQGLRPIAWPTAFNSLQELGLWKGPKAANLYLLDMAAHEYLGILWAYMTGKIDHWPI